MASQLYKVLNNIDSSRKNIINTLSSKGVQVNKNTSLNEINAWIQGLTLSSNNNNYDILEMANVTMENDPAIWRRPEDWPNLENIFTNKTNFVNYEGSTRSYAPGYAILIDCELNDMTEMCITILDYNASTHTLPTLAMSGNDNGISFIVETSDGVFYELLGRSSTNKEFTHTWDRSKDIVTNSGKHYKYIIVYTRITSSTSGSSQNPNFTSLKAVELIIAHGFWPSGALSIGSTVQSLILMDPPTDLGKTSSIINKQPDLRATDNVKRLICKQTMFLNPKLYTTTSLNYVELTTYSEELISINTVYLKIPYYLGAAGNNSSTPSTYGGGRYTGLKYLIVDPEQQAKQTGFRGLGYHPCLTYTNLFEYLSTIDVSSSVTYAGIGFPQNIKCIILPNVKTAKGANSSSLFGGAGTLDLVSLPNLTTVVGEYCPTGNNVIISTLSLPSLEEVNFSFYGKTRVILLDNVTTITAAKFSKESYYENLIRYFYAPKLTKCPYGYFEKGYFIQWITLGEGFRGTNGLDLSTCPVLDPVCIKDIISKLDDVSETGEIYILNLGSNKGKISQKELDIATNKGWEVK